MLAAELHGKLGDGTNARDRMEDILTSNVFGLLRCVEHSKLLIPWLSRCLRAEDSSPELIDEAIDRADIRFWPRLNQQELDVLILLHGSRGIHVVGVECKYESGKSGALSDTSGTGLEASTPRGDQLADYMNALAADAVRPRPYSPEAVHRRSLIYLTAHASAPRDELEASLQFRHPTASIDLYWLAWRQLTPLLPQEAVGPDVSVLLSDLRRVLERRGLSTFTGWHAPTLAWSLLQPERLFQVSRDGKFFERMSAPSLPADATFWKGTTRRGA
ncbi:hypothetical protein SAMN05443572_105395 [Myxococcus fulvus]|uniref:NERD domain-containing protein n=1 Tax=Myxococcus fulvus TaxID=33 RepID=A0A511T4P9_MYXFU|nr:hypothetical protein [Myxococcus fulvus]GEN09139.1 hypothetical protein MFU01_41760 [Myxococcus fulvus]SEU15786.1 hypothetical protein SAMN05443572_105395 [Myxococcus fulvus]